MEAFKNETSIDTSLPWVVFRIGKNQCAVSSKKVDSITLLTDEVTAIPNAQEHIRGLLSIRGATIPLLDLRSAFGQATLMEESKEFADMLEKRKQDHLNWATALRKSIDEGSEFELTTDPHKCAFGKWYDSYNADRTTVKFQLGKIDGPHQKLHHAAVLAQEAKRLEDKEERDKLLKKIIDEVEREDVPKIVSLLDETKDVMQDSIREQVLVIGDEGNQIGCVVDEVLSVQSLTAIGGKESMGSSANTRYVVGIAENEQGLVLMLDENMFEKSYI